MYVMKVGFSNYHKPFEAGPISEAQLGKCWYEGDFNSYSDIFMQLL